MLDSSDTAAPLSGAQYWRFRHKAPHEAGTLCRLFRSSVVPHLGDYTLHSRFTSAQQNLLDEMPILIGASKETTMIIWSGWGAVIVLAGTILGGAIAALF